MNMYSPELRGGNRGPVISPPYLIKGTPKVIMHKSVSRLLLNTWIRKKRSKERREREPPKGFKLKNVLRTADRLEFLNKGPMSLEKRYFSPHLPEVIQQPDPPPHTRSILPGSGVSPIPSSKKKAPTYFLTFVRRWNKMMVVHSRWRNLGGPVVKNPHLSMQGTRIWSLVQEDPTCLRATKPAGRNYWGPQA